MKQTKFDKLIIIQEFEEEKKTQAKYLNDYLQLEVDRITSLLERNDKDIVTEYIGDIKRQVGYLKNYYKTLEKNDRKIEDTIYHNNLKILNQELTDCMAWLDGNKDIDLSFIPGIQSKKIFANKTREEIKEELEVIRENRELAYNSDRTTADVVFDNAVNSYEPVRERVDAIRSMNYLEKAQKASINEKIRKYLHRLLAVATISAIPSIMCGAILRIYEVLTNLGSLAVIGLTEATCLALGMLIIPLQSHLNYIQKKKDYEKAKSDLEEVGLYKEVEDHLVKKKKW